ncbi:hypothetical protein [Janthinobacterium sp. HLX7-2]|uniref:hypothetical protein n=1 Tax=Janthinobacterium sp. HLX7-2 TaxID=1259331 RepID=UPI003F283249
MDPISRATLPNAIPATPRVGETAALAPAVRVPTSAAPAAIPILSSTQVDISPLGQFLSGVALSRRQLLALQGVTDEPRAGATPINVNDDLLALARQLTQSFAQLQTSGIDASDLATAGDTQGSLAQRYDLLSGDGTTGAAAALAQDGTLLTQAGLARIGIDLRNEDVDAATLQAAYAADSNATLGALQQGTDVLAQVGAVLARQQGMPLAAVVEADLTGDALPGNAALAASAGQLQAIAPNEPGPPGAPPQTAAIAQRQLEIQQQLETEELSLDLQELRPAPQLPQAQQLPQPQQALQAQQLAAQKAAMAVLPPSSEDPSVAAAIAAYNLNNAALNPGLMNRPLPASDSRLPLVAPVAPVEPVKPVNKI